MVLMTCVSELQSLLLLLVFLSLMSRREELEFRLRDELEGNLGTGKGSFLWGELRSDKEEEEEEDGCLFWV